MTELETRDALVVKEKPVFQGHWEEPANYGIFDPSGAVLYHVKEEMSVLGFITRSLFRSWHSITLHVRNTAGKNCLRLHRPWPLLRDEMRVYDESGRFLGKSRWGVLRIKTFTVSDATGNKIYKVVGPFWRKSPWKIIDANGEKVGEITKHWAGLKQEFWTDSDNFSLVFHQGICVDHKVLLLGTLLHIDFIFFEQG